MGLNQLLHRHQISLMRADTAASPEARHSHRDLALRYARRIEAEGRRDRGDRAPLVPLS